VVQWLSDRLKAIKGSGGVQQLAGEQPDSGGVMFVPAFTGLGAPCSKADARGAIVGLTGVSTVAHIARAALESITFQSAALLQAMGRDAVSAGEAPVAELRVDSGACVNDLLMQFQADLLGIPVVRPKLIETTALRAAYLVGLSCGLFKGLDELAAQWAVERNFRPTMQRERAGGAVDAELGAGSAADHGRLSPAERARCDCLQRVRRDGCRHKRPRGSVCHWSTRTPRLRDCL